jgi:hypothetical protein
MTSLEDGGRIHLTQSALVMEQIIGQFLYSMAAEKKPDKQPDAGQPEQKQPAEQKQPEGKLPDKL